jgi:hypothetical protein
MGVVRRLLRTARSLAEDPAIPGWLRWLFVFGLLPIPLFFDELALILATAVMYVLHRERVVRAWRAAGRVSGAAAGVRADG